MSENLKRIEDAIKSNNLRDAVIYISQHADAFHRYVDVVFNSKDDDTKQKLLRLVDKLSPKLTMLVIKRALEDQNLQIRVGGLQAVYRTRLESLNQDVERLLLSRKNDFEIRKWALHILASTDHIGFGRTIRKIARDKDESVVLRREAIFALTNVPDDESIGLLCIMLGDEEKNIRQAAAWALGRIRSKDSICCLLAALEDEENEVRDWAIRALRDMDDTRALQGLANAIKSAESNEQTRLIRLVAEKRSEIILRAIAEALESPFSEVRREAAWALGVSPYPPAATSLLKLLDDSDLQTRDYAKKALKRLGL